MIDWERGKLQPSLREKMTLIIKNHPDRVWTPPEMRGELFPDVEFTSLQEAGQQEFMMSLIGVAQTNALVKAIMERLVYEGILEKREFRVDQISETTINEEKYEELMEHWADDDVYANRMYYRSNTES